MAYINSDGLFIKIGAEAAEVAKGGIVNTSGHQSVLEVQVTLANLTGTAQILGNGSVGGNAVGFQVPRGARIDSVETIADVSAASAGATTIDLGLVALDRTTVINATGLVSALPKTVVDIAGETTLMTAGTTSAGALVGSVLGAAGLLTARANVGPFTAGSVTVRIRFTMAK